MARVTVEDCILKIPNRFKLVMMAAQRSRALSVGTPLTVDRDNDKNPVVALREIADGMVAVEELEEGLVRGLQKHVDVDEPVDDTAELLAMEETLGGLAGAGVAEAFGATGEAAVDEELDEDEALDEDELGDEGEAGPEPEPKTDEED